MELKTLKLELVNSKRSSYGTEIELLNIKLFIIN